MHKTIRILKLATLCLLLAAGLARAESTGWITGRELWVVTDRYKQRNMMPVSVKCKDSGAKGLDLSAGLVNMEWVPNSQGLGWTWMGSTNLKNDLADMKAQGYTLVSKDSFRRKSSGLPVYCLIFHK